MKRTILIALALTLLVSLTLPVTAMAKTNWDLEGWRADAGKWMDGLLFTYHEDDWVQYRLKATRYNGDDTTITIRHDYQDADGAFGIDDVDDFFIGEQTNRTTGPDVSPIPGTAGLFTVTPWSEEPVPNGKELHFSFNVPDPEALIAAVEAEVGHANFAFYWKAHLALTDSPPGTLGSSYWNGASLHAHTSVTGSQDVPIKTPPQEAPPPPPDIDVVKEISLDGGINYIDANEAPVPGDPNYHLIRGTEIWWRIVVCNTGGVELTDIELTDVMYKDGAEITNPYYDLSTYTYPTTLAPGQCFPIVIGPCYITGCVYQNIVTAVGVCSSGEVWDVDDAWFSIE